MRFTPRSLPAVDLFLKGTTSKMKTGLLLITTFGKTKLWPPGFVPWWPFLHCRVSNNFAFLSTSNFTDDAVGFTVTKTPHLL